MNTPKIVPTHNVHSTPNLHAICTAAREYVNPVDYRHPHDSLRRFAGLSALSAAQATVLQSAGAA